MQPDPGHPGRFPENCASALEIAAARELDYSICVCVTRPAQYGEMVESFRTAGFGPPSTEFLYVDNSGANTLDAFAAYNLFLRVARGRYVILCHQDIVLLDDRQQLDLRIAELEQRDPGWALLGNSGGVSFTSVASRITDPWGADKRLGGPFPVQVQSLDENFIVARAAANLALSSDLGGFHLYGTDLCVIADILGHRAYVIDFHIWHKGRGTLDESFYAIRRALIAKFNRAFRARAIATTCTALVLSASRAMSSIGNVVRLKPLVAIGIGARRRLRKISGLAITAIARSKPTPLPKEDRSSRNAPRKSGE